MKSQWRQRRLLIPDWNSPVSGKHISLCCVWFWWRKAAKKKKNKQKQYKTKQKQLAEVLELVENVFTLLTSWTKPSTGLGVEATELTTIQFWSFVKRFHGLLCWNLLLIISLPCTRNKKIRERCLPWRSGLNSADISAAGINSHPA